MPVAANRRSHPAESADDTRKRILGAAFAAFTEHGYAGTSTLDIATRAKVSKRELYALFENKQAMLEACIGHGAQLLRMPVVLPAVRDRAGLIAVLGVFGANFLRVFLGPSLIAVYRLALAEAERAPEVAQLLETKGAAAVRGALALLLREAQGAGAIGVGEIAAMIERYFALLLAGWHMRVLLGVIAPPDTAAIEARAKETAGALLRLYPPA